MDSSTMWHGNIDPRLSLNSNDEFLLDLDMGMQFDFQSNFDAHHSNHLMQQNNRDAMDTHMHDESGRLGQMDTVMHEQIPTTNGSTHSTVPNTPIVQEHVPNDHLVELDAQIQYLQQQRKQAQERQMQEQQRNFYAQSNMIPPTPNSFDMHPNVGGYYPQADQQPMFDQYHLRLKEHEMAFTPLVSPAVTPLDTHFNIPDYTAPGACFSPLSSPALHAQNERRAIYGPQRSDTSNTTSPVEMNIDSNQGPPSSASIARKSTRKAAAKPRATRAVRQSPIVKPQKKKTGSTAISAQALADILEPNPQQENVRNSSSTASTEVSENGSISPEHLSDMAPPPLPHSTKASPYLQAQNVTKSQQSSLGGGNISPATPASLMRITKSPNQAAQQSPSVTNAAESDLNAIDNFVLPGPAQKTKPRPTHIDTQSDGQTTPTLESNGTKRIGFQPLPSPGFARPPLPKSTTQSPQINAMSPSGSTPGRKTPQLSATRNTKKRSSASSVHVSPALRPRISPSIKPLLPGGPNGGGVSDETASLLLASKSNYQNILEGTLIEGVQYPKELERGLTSKRTSHKIAEQGRRNRINSALQEIATLLPSRTTSKESGGEKSDNGAAEREKQNEEKKGAQNANSKASTVELAIDYIKTLKNDLAEAQRRADEAEKKLKQLSTVETITAD